MAGTPAAHNDAGAAVVYRRETTKERKYPCAACGKRFTRPSSLACHRRTHTGEKPHVCPVAGCGRQFSVQSNLRRHMRIHEKTLSPTPATATTASSPALPQTRVRRKKSCADPASLAPLLPPLAWSHPPSQPAVEPLRLPLASPAVPPGLDLSALYSSPYSPPAASFPLTAPIYPAAHMVAHQSQHPHQLLASVGLAGLSLMSPAQPRPMMTPPPPPPPPLVRSCTENPQPMLLHGRPVLPLHPSMAPLPLLLAPCSPAALSSPPGLAPWSFLGNLQ
ncbi:hypothetical protein IWQ56_007223 [Coemansia nantahalensis]|uniref:Uncharacterized protein n=1 Tax=Coemansia helicoidea TaxID=1286919 RepID=A0ACC1L024_9FUNG|nr:hypothetical protein IWQ56_007223 [Coemansia nantahalensis]KAJ2798282.1 hypothetical protein H4R21_003995 [Coemansia helicoidea]